MISWKSIKTVSVAVFLVLALAAVAIGGKKFEPIATGSMSPGDALLELTPSVESSGRLVVKFAANTHTVDLSSYDLKAIATLEVQGRTIAPSKADNLRGHHTFGKIIFDVGKEVDAFTIKVIGLPAEAERVYEWK